MNGLVFGIDLGIASCGWAVLRHPTPGDQSGEIVAMGSWMFDVPETDKERTPTNQIRRGNRLLRRVIRRRAQRMGEIRRLFAQHGLLVGNEPDALKRAGLDPWELRTRGLDKPLSPAEFAVALGHIAKRRGFKSARKGKEANTASDDQKMLKALEATRERLGRYRTVGEMFGRDADFRDRKRNRDGLFDRTQSRDDLIHEVAKLFEAQRRLGNDTALVALESEFTAIAFRQLEMQDSEKLVGMCQFEPKEKRAARFAPSFEKFRLLGKLVNLRITAPEGERPLTPEEIRLATGDLGKTAKLSVKEVRKRIGLPADQRFTAFKPEDEAQDIAARTGEAMHGTRKLRDALGEVLWTQLQAQPEQLDRIAHVISFHETADKIGVELGKLGLPAGAVDALLKDLAVFSRFKGAGHISAKAARALIPHLEAGLRYDQACAMNGWDHTATRWSKRAQVVDKKSFNKLVEEMLEGIANPIARKSLTEGLKQLWAMCNRWGLPDAIHIEMARAVGNSLEERRKIEKRLNDTTAQRNRERDEVREHLGLEDVSTDTLLRYRLWKEQGGKCLYTGADIHITQVIATDNSVQVDHILPWSRFGDDSYNNKTLCLASANQQKKRATPFEWFSIQKTQEEWATFVARIETNKELRGFKKRNYLLKNAEEAAERFRSRNLNDTRYACRLLADAVKLFYPEGDRQEKGGNRRVFTRPGGLTSALRHAWGVESLKKVDGKRVEDARHHALDALVVAAIGEWEVQRLTRSYQEWEQKGRARPLRQVDPPWGDAASFRREVKEAYDNVFVARPERRRARGEGHAATIRQVKERDGALVVYERKSITDLSEKRLQDIKDPERNQGVIEAIREWIANGKPTDSLPRSPAGDEIRKVRLRTKGKPAVHVRGGTADRGEIVRVDVFARPNKRGKDEFYLVPIYPHHVMNKRDWPMPPMRAVVAYKDEEDWTLIDHSFAFRFSLYPRNFVEVVKSTGEVFEGYFAGMDRSTGAVNPQSPHHPQDFFQGSWRKNFVNHEKVQCGSLRHAFRSEIRGPHMAWRGLHISNPARLTHRSRQIVVDPEGSDEALTFPVEDIAWIILDTPQVSVSGSLLSALAENGVAMVVPDAKHHPAGMLLSFHQHHAQAAIAHAQISMSQPLKKRLWQKLVSAKIENQAAVLRGIGSDHATALSAMAGRVGSGDPDNLEAQAARAYWQRLFEGFRRHDEDRRNGLLNYGYAVVRAALARSCAASGLLPAFGLHHRSRTNPFNLVDDLIEPFRPVVDRMAHARVTAEERDEMDVEDRRHMAGILSENTVIGEERLTILAATEAVAASLVRSIEAGNATPLNTPALPLARRN